MKYKLIFVLMFLMIVAPIISAQIYKQDTAINISIPCRFNNTQCKTYAVCNVTVFDNEEVRLISNRSINSSVNSFIVVELNETQTANFGVYRIDLFCSQDKISDSPSIEFEITPTGEDLSEAQGMIYLVMLLAGFVIFGLCLWGTIKIPFRDVRDEDDEQILSVNGLKPVKVILGFFSYLSLLFISTIIHDVAQSYLFLSAIEGFFNIIQLVLLILVYPLFLLTIIIAVKLLATNIKNQDLINKGIWTE